MGTIVTLSSKGQLVIPAAMRDALGLRTGHSLELTFDESDSRITISPVPTLDELSARITAYASRSGAKPVTNVDDYYQANRRPRL